MADLPTPDEWKRIQGSLQGAGLRLRKLARQLRDRDADVQGGQAERAAWHVEQARCALLAPAGPDEAPRTSPIPCLSGSSEAIPLCSVLSFLAGINASGVMRAYGAEEAYVLQFENGYLVYAHGDDPPRGMLLGELLVHQGALAAEDLRRALEEGWTPGETLGGVLLREELIQPTDLEMALVAQIQNLGSRLFSQENVRFRFYAGERVIERQDVRMNVMSLLLETARVQDEERRAADEWTPPESCEFHAAERLAKD